MEQLLTTKLYIPPTRPEIVSRPRLIERLNEGLDRKLTLISAPAGFGKTTLVSEWVDILRSQDPSESQNGNRIGWISLDERDNDHARFLAYFITAMRQANGVGSTIGERSLSILQSHQPPPTEAVLTALINEVASVSDRIILVLDDYHIIESSMVDEALTFTLEHLPPQLHLIIATRDDPQQPIARLRAQGQLTEIRAADLRFTNSEAAKFLNQVMGLNLSKEDIAALETRTEGWIAGLQMAAISMQGHKDTASQIKTFTGSHRFVLDYLIEEVLEQQSESIQTFLLHTAILTRLTGPLCDALTGQDTGQENLEKLEHANLFIIPLDEERCWYRYHQLFADLLRQRLRHAHLEKLPMLHCRASEWYEQNGFVDEAIDHALRADEFERAAYLIEEHVDALWQRGAHTKLRGWINLLPVELVFSRPHLCILHAWNLFTSGQQDAAEQCLQKAEKALHIEIDLADEQSQLEQIQLPGFERMKIRGRAAAIRAFLASYRGDVPGIYEYSHQALEFLPEQDLIWRSTATVALGDAYSFSGELEAAYRIRLEAFEASKAAGNLYMNLIASMKLAVTLRQQGRLQRVLEICQQQLRLANESGLAQTVVVGWLLAIWGEVLAELNDLDQALHKAKKGAALTERGRDVAMIGWSYLCLIRVLFTRGDLAEADDVIRKMDHIAQEHFVPPWITNLVAAWQARIWLVQDNLEAASQWVQARELDGDGALNILHEMENIVLARILIAQGKLNEATRLLQRLLDVAEIREHTTRVIEIYIVQALVSYAKGDSAGGMTALERALTLAEPGGFISIFVDEGFPMAHLLYEALNCGIATDYVRRLLAAFPSAELEESAPSKYHTTHSDLIEPLSDREIEVLHLIAEGLTNPEIAARLYLSLNTIKVHTRNIYGKLGANNRTGAVARGRALGVLPST